MPLAIQVYVFRANECRIHVRAQVRRGNQAQRLRAVVHPQMCSVPSSQAFGSAVTLYPYKSISADRERSHASPLAARCIDQGEIPAAVDATSCHVASCTSRRVETVYGSLRARDYANGEPSFATSVDFCANTAVLVDTPLLRRLRAPREREPRRPQELALLPRPTQPLGCHTVLTARHNRRAGGSRSQASGS